MKSYLILLLALVLIALNAGCTGHANFSASPGHYAVSGTSYNPETMVAVLSNGNVQETYARTYRDCAATGRCYGAGVNGTAYYWLNDVPPPIAAPPPQQIVVVQTTPPAATVMASPQGGEVATKQELNAVDLKATCAQVMAENIVRAKSRKPLTEPPANCPK